MRLRVCVCQVRSQDRGASDAERARGQLLSRELNARILPFFLRRTKQQVLAEGRQSDAQSQAHGSEANQRAMSKNSKEEAVDEHGASERSSMEDDDDDFQPTSASQKSASYSAGSTSTHSSAFLSTSASSSSSSASASASASASSSASVSTSVGGAGSLQPAAAAAPGACASAALLQLGAVQKNDLILWCTLTDPQLALYRGFLELAEVRDLLNSTRSPLAALTVLKKACDHVQLCAGVKLVEDRLPHVGWDRYG
jgi:hypothetical protein